MRPGEIILAESPILLNAGRPTIELSVENTSDHTVWIGSHENTVAMDTYDITMSERCVQGSYAATMAELQLSVDLLAQGKIDGSSWIKTFPLDEGVTAFNRMLAAEADDIKGVLCP